MWYERVGKRDESVLSGDVVDKGGDFVLVYVGVQLYIGSGEFGVLSRY